MKRQKSFNEVKPTLYLVATPIGNLNDMTYRAVETLKNVDIIACEDTRVTKKLCIHFDIQKKMISHHQHNYNSSTSQIIDYIQSGNNVALVSDAGYPAISDPGQELVKACIEQNINVVAIPGANALLQALVVSGLDTNQFTFIGFLNSQKNKRRKELENYYSNKETLIFYEAPHRIKDTLNDILEIFGDRHITLSRELTKKFEEIIRGKVSDVVKIADELKGEMVIVVEGNDHIEQNYQTTTNEQVDIYIEMGMKASEAIKRVAKERQMSKNEVYSLYHGENE